MMNRPTTRIQTLFAALLAVLGTCTSICAETITVCSSGGPPGGCQYTSIYQAIQAAENGDVIQLYDTDIPLGSQGLNVFGKAITIQGAPNVGTVLNGQNSWRILTCSTGEGAGTIFRDLTFQYGNAANTSEQQGGALLVQDAGPMFVNCHFRDNRSEKGGGAVLLENASPTFSECTFRDNYTETLGADGGAIFSVGSSTTFISCDFESNQTYSTSSGENGGAWYSTSGNGSPDGPHTFVLCTFQSNRSGARGGALYLSGEATFSNCDFRSNLAEYTTGSAYGGAVYSNSGTLEMSGCWIENNRATAGLGGGVYARTSTLTDCVFENNDARSGAGLWCSSGTFDMTQCTFTDNEATDSGGGFGCGTSADVHITFCDFRNNSAGLEGGGLYIQSSTGLLQNTIACGNTPDQVFGGFPGSESGTGVCQAPTCVDTDENGTPDTCEGVGSILNVPDDYPTIAAALDEASYGDTVSIAAGTYLEETLNPVGRAIHVIGSVDENGHPVTIIEYSGAAGPTGHVLRCTSGEHGGTVFENLILRGGEAELGGGAFLQGSSPSFRNCVFRENTASSSGGGFHAKNASPLLTDCLITANASPTGSGFSTTESTAEATPRLEDTILCGNDTLEDPLDLGQTSGPWTNLSGSCVTVNCTDANQDGVPDQCEDASGEVLLVPSEYATIFEAIAAAGPGATIELAAGTYQPGKAINPYGLPLTIRGAVDETGLPTTIIDGQGLHGLIRCTTAETSATRFENLHLRNGASQDGAGAYCLGSSPEFLNCTFSENTASRRGGGLCIILGSPIIQSCRFEENEANYQSSLGGGGGMYVQDSTGFTLTGSSFTGNVGTFGSAIHVRDCTSVQVNDSAFRSNLGVPDADVFSIQDNRGGGLWISSGEVTIDNCTFEDNQTGYGAGIDVVAGELHVLRTRFTNNHSAIAGGALCVEAGDVTIRLTECVINGNSADLYAGGLFDFGLAEVALDIKDTIICENSTGQLRANWTDLGGNCVTHACVDQDLDGIPDCTDIEPDLDPHVPSEYGSIAAAVDAAAPGATITIAPGVYQPAQTIETFGKKLTIRGSVDTDGQLLTTILGTRSRWTFACLADEGPETVFSQLTLTGGSVGIQSVYASPRIIDSVIQENAIGIDTFDYYGGIPCSTEVLRTLVCNNGTDQISGPWSDLGENCISDECLDSDLDGTLDCYDLCPFDPELVVPGACGCGVADEDLDGSGTLDCFEIDVPEDYDTIQDAINSAQDGSIIRVAAGTYNLAGTTWDIDGINPQGKRLTLQGATDDSGSPATILDGNWSHRVLQCVNGEGPDTIFENLVLKNGVGQDLEIGSITYVMAGAALLRESSPTFRNCIFDGNWAHFGGALYVTGGSPRFLDCEFMKNTALQSGGAGYIENLSGPTFENCRIAGNDATNAGGFLTDTDSTTQFTNCVFEDNQAEQHGGAVYDYESQAGFQDCQFLMNTAEDRGGAFFASGSQATLVQCDFTGNGSGTGGAVALEASGFTSWDRCTFQDNVALDAGGAIMLSSTSAWMTHSWITGNSSWNLGGGIHSEAATIALLECTIQGNTTSLAGGGLFAQAGSPVLTGVNLCGNLPDQAFGVIEQPGNCIAEDCSECPIDWCPDDPEKTEPGECGCGVPETDSDGDGTPDCLDPPCPADLDGDGAVDGADLTLLLADWGCTGAGCVGDFDGSGTVDGADLTIILSAWGDCE